MQDQDLASNLAQICNTILLNQTTVCQAFTWDAAQHLVFFKGQAVNSRIDASSVLCNSPNITTWVLNSGNVFLKSGLPSHELS